MFFEFCVLNINEQTVWRLKVFWSFQQFYSLKIFQELLFSKAFMIPYNFMFKIYFMFIFLVSRQRQRWPSQSASQKENDWGGLLPVFAWQWPSSLLMVANQNPIASQATKPACIYWIVNHRKGSSPSLSPA